MKRSAALTPLSHDHQHGLAVALALTRATDAASAADAARAFVLFWREEGQRHFREEHGLAQLESVRHTSCKFAGQPNLRRSSR